MKIRKDTDLHLHYKTIKSLLEFSKLEVGVTSRKNTEKLSNDL